jgi:hypothetical protein
MGYRLFLTSILTQAIFSYLCLSTFVKDFPNHTLTPTHGLSPFFYSLAKVHQVPLALPLGVLPGPIRMRRQRKIFGTQIRRGLQKAVRVHEQAEKNKRGTYAPHAPTTPVACTNASHTTHKTTLTHSAKLPPATTGFKN